VKLSDLFLPQIARSDPAERKKGVLKVNNIAVLQQVIKRDKDPEVRRLALKQLKKIAMF
jgi:hypothetical protein